MGNIKCCQCGYFDNSDVCNRHCSRYDIPADKDNACVDSDELCVSNNDK